MILHRRQVRAMTYEVALVEGLTRAGEQFGYCRVLAMARCAAIRLADDEVLANLLHGGA